MVDHPQLSKNKSMCFNFISHDAQLPQLELYYLKVNNITDMTPQSQELRSLVFYYIQVYIT